MPELASPAGCRFGQHTNPQRGHSYSLVCSLPAAVRLLWYMCLAATSWQWHLFSPMHQFYTSHSSFKVSAGLQMCTFGKSLLRREQTKVCTLPRSFTLPVKSIYIIFNKLLSTTKKKIFLYISLLAPVREPLLSFHTWRGSAWFSVIQLKVAIPGPEQSSCVCSSAKHCLLDLGFSGPAQGWGTFKVGALCIWSGPKWQCKVVPFDFDICQAPLFSPLCSPPSFCSKLILPAALHRYQGAFDFSL